MYLYNEFDETFVRNRVAQFRGQVEKRISGQLTEDEFKPLRLMNGLYLQLHAYMLRVAVPYGTLDAPKMRQLAMIAERWDKGYGHFTTRQNIQFNWPKLQDVPDILDALADVEMHAIQTSGNTVRNVTADHFAGAAADEIEDPRPAAELLRQWSTDHPEFQSLPRKFKIAVSGSPNDRAVVKAHDIGLQMVRNEAGETGFEVVIGGGLGRSPFVGKVLRSFLPKAELLPYVEAILHVYNLNGRRDNKYKARIKILVHEAGLDEIREAVEDAFERSKAEFKVPSDQLIAGIEATFQRPDLTPSREDIDPIELSKNKALATFVNHNVTDHAVDGYSIVTISLKPIGGTPGDATADQMRTVANLAERHGHNEIRVSHEQNLILPHIKRTDLPAVHAALVEADLATANVGLISDIIACPGMDYCALATARSIPVAQEISTRFNELKLEHEIGPLKVKISGCINACGHHHVGHIGILGLDRAGVENYQITLGGDGTETMTIGERTGPGFAAEDLVPAIERIIDTYLRERTDQSETFLQAYRRLGGAPFKQALYPAQNKAA
ncbi:nitrite/sulfite reductase [Pseudahrensia aquimaris]|uniref:Nitrite/sulfite reductase n=1 Tax=Pseudahrensia aquimaris TaxID=744461 RepID=A0ABW3FC57_9HYPH